MSNYSIAITNRQRAVRCDRRRLTKLARSVLAREQVESAEISVAIVDDREIHAINRQFLNHDAPTDVISFLLGEGKSDGQQRFAEARHHAARKGTRASVHRVAGRAAGSARGAARRGTGKVIDGEIVMSAQMALRAAPEHDTCPEDELAL